MTAVVAVVAVILVSSVLVYTGTAEAKSKSYLIRLFLNNGGGTVSFGDNKVPITIKAYNDHNKAIASDKLDLNARIDDDDEQLVHLAQFDIKDKKDQHPNDVKACVIGKHGKVCTTDFDIFKHGGTTEIEHTFSAKPIAKIT